MPERNGQQGTGRHPHKDTQEPWPHTKEEGRQHGGEHARHSESRSHDRQHETAHSGGSASQQHDDRSENADLKRREYRDEKGEVHHHTRTYMDQHGSGHGGGSHSGGSHDGDRGRSDRNR